MGEGKLERRAAKAAKRAARAAARDQATADLPILWVVPTGVESYHRGYHCRECKAYTEQPMPTEAIEEYRRIRAPKWEWPEPRPTIVCKCGATVEMNSAGLDAEYHAPSTGEVFERVRDLPAGAVWDHPTRELGDRELCNWHSNVDDKGRPFPEPPKGEDKRCRLIDRPGVDGRVLICRLPDGHDWVIDSRANNCTLPLDDDHWCWNRSGRPEDGTLDVRKGKPGQTTCSAGGGSIATPGYHGFLHDGRLRRC